MGNNLKKYIKELIAEIENDELDIEEATTSGDIAGYNTPNLSKVPMVLMKMQKLMMMWLIESTNLLDIKE